MLCSGSLSPSFVSVLLLFLDRRASVRSRARAVFPLLPAAPCVSCNWTTTRELRVLEENALLQARWRAMLSRR